MSGLIGRKLGMGRVFDENGRNVVVTLIQAGPCAVTQIKTVESDGYNAIQLGFEARKEKRTSKAQVGHFKKAGVAAKRIVREFRDVENTEDYKLGDELKVDLFSVGERVMVTGWSKGKGFQGVVKRHGFGGGPKTHGQSDRLRAPGSLGQSSNPSRVFKGIKMAGRIGNDKVTIKKRRVVKVVPEQNVMMVEGSIPGPNSGLVLVRK